MDDATSAVSTVGLLVGGLAESGSASNATVAHEAELGVVVAGLQDGGRDLAAVVFAVEPVITRTVSYVCNTAVSMRCGNIIYL